MWAVIGPVLAVAGLAGIPFVVRALRREKWHERQPQVRVNMFADELADRGLADLAEEGGKRFGSAINLESRRPL